MKRKTIYWIVGIALLVAWYVRKNRLVKECAKHHSGGISGGSCPSKCMGNNPNIDFDPDAPVVFDAAYPCYPSPFTLFNRYY